MDADIPAEIAARLEHLGSSRAAESRVRRHPGLTASHFLSSFRIVPTPCAFDIVALAAPLRLTKNVSSGSFTLSPLTATVIVFDVWPGVNVSVPEAAL